MAKDKWAELADRMNANFDKAFDKATLYMDIIDYVVKMCAPAPNDTSEVRVFKEEVVDVITNVLAIEQSRKKDNNDRTD